MKRYALFKIKEGRLDQWKQWCNLLMTTRKEEALASLPSEGVSKESCYLFTLGTEHFVVGVAEFFAEHKEADMSLKVNQDHMKQKKECLEYVCEMDSLFDLG